MIITYLRKKINIIKKDFISSNHVQVDLSSLFKGFIIFFNMLLITNYNPSQNFFRLIYKIEKDRAFIESLLTDFV